MRLFYPTILLFFPFFLALKCSQNTILYQSFRASCSKMRQSLTMYNSLKNARANDHFKTFERMEESNLLHVLEGAKKGSASTELQAYYYHPSYFKELQQMTYLSNFALCKLLRGLHEDVQHMLLDKTTSFDVLINRIVDSKEMKDSDDFSNIDAYQLLKKSHHYNLLYTRFIIVSAWESLRPVKINAFNIIHDELLFNASNNYEAEVLSLLLMMCAFDTLLTKDMQKQLSLTQEDIYNRFSKDHISIQEIIDQSYTIIMKQNTIYKNLDRYTACYIGDLLTSLKQYWNKSIVPHDSTH